ncbi:MAG: hypothetical protein HY381_00470 [Candidatus Chisholmbacteria bacterium]|nr:hypothetical protein [Candidatus Chisholmbacteria bacterium]
MTERDHIEDWVSFEQDFCKFCDQITTRQLAVVIMLGDGMNLTEIGEELGVSQQAIHDRLNHAKKVAIKIWGEDIKKRDRNNLHRKKIKEDEFNY